MKIQVQAIVSFHEHNPYPQGTAPVHKILDYGEIENGRVFNRDYMIEATKTRTVEFEMFNKDV